MHGRFACSNELLNQIHGNIQRSLKVALKGIVIDCVHREPLAYNEPCGIFGALSIRKCMPQLWTRFARDIQLGGSDNGDLSDIVPVLPGMKRQSDVSQNASYPMLIWHLYECHGDERLLQQHYRTVNAWVDFIGRELADSTHIVNNGWLGEHMLPKRGSEPGWYFSTKETPKEYIWTCYYYHNVRVLANMSRILGKKEQEERYAKLAQEIHAVINKTWLDRKTGHYATKSQTSEILALALDIVPQENKRQLVENIAGTINDNGGRMRVGHVGLPGFMESLVDHGLGEVVYKAVNTTDFPGWGYMISQGATTVWEGWSLSTAVEEWNNHIYHAEESMIFLTGVSRFFYNSISGIQEPAFYGTREFEPGYGLIRIKPHVLGDLTYANASIKTVKGIISSSWKKTDASLTLEVTIPANATAQVSVPTLGLKEFAITEGGKAIWQNDSYVDGVAGIADARRDVDWVTFDVGSGRYCFELSEAKSHRP
jgi:alpha-L-rhamnosidase